MTPGPKYFSDPSAVVPTAAGGLRISRLLAPLLERAGRLVLVATLVAALVAAYSVTRPRKFEATVMASTVGGSSRLANLSASLPAVLMAAASAGGLQATPALLVKLASSRNVLVRVGRARVPGRADSSVADILREHRVPASRDDEVVKALERVAAASIDRETGLVTLTVIHKDSAVARFVADTLLGTISGAFQAAVHSQATETRSSLSARLDSANAALRRTEQELADFRARNRVVPAYSELALQQDRIQRELLVAQTVYNQARTESEAAKAKELGDDPTVVVVDPIPRELVPVPRGTVTKSIVAAVVVAGLYAIFLIIRDVAKRGATTAAEDRERLRAVAYRLPVVRRWVA